MCNFYDVNWGSKSSSGSKYRLKSSPYLSSAKADENKSDSASALKNPYQSIPTHD